MTNLKKVTVRGRGGKAHRAFIRESAAAGTDRPITRRSLVMACSCPGAMNGSLVKRCVIIADGWDHANCRQEPAKAPTIWTSQAPPRHLRGLDGNGLD